MPSSYGSFNHDSKDLFEACGFDEQLVKKIRSKIHTDITSCKKASLVVEKIEAGLIDPETSDKLIRPVCLILTQAMVESIKQENILHMIAGAVSKLKDNLSKSDDDDDSSLEIPKEKIIDYCKDLTKRHIATRQL